MKADRSAEDFVMQAVKSGVIEIDDEGRCWRNDPRRRAETPGGGGYLQLRFQVDGKRHSAMAHRIVYRTLVGEIPAGLTINHKGKSGNRTDNRPGNLEVATYAEQIVHAKAVLGRKYRDVRGEGNHMVKLKPAEVQIIRQRRSLGEKLADIARDFGIKFQQVSRIARGSRWRSLPIQEVAT